MLGLFLIYFIGKSYYELADKFSKNKWGFAILGVVVYYFGTFLAGFFYAILSEMGVTDFFMELPDVALSFFALPFGLLACWGVYKMLENKWKNQSTENDSGLLDSELIRNSQKDSNRNSSSNF